MFTKLIQQYKHKCWIYLSWDAASWLISKMLRDYVDRHNGAIGFVTATGVEMKRDKG